MRLLLMFAFAVLVPALGTSAAAATNGYRLVSGDKVEIFHSGLETPLTAVVDADGQIRMINVGSVSVTGMTLDEAEDNIESEMMRQGLFVDPRVSLQILAYAPVIVAGDVSSPGKYEFSPGMTVASAIALAGGSQAKGMTRTEVLRLRAIAETQVRAKNLEIAEAVVELAYHEAMLKGPEAPLTVTDELRIAVPDPSTVNMAGLIAAQNDLLQAERGRTRDLLAFWDQEIQTIEQQRANFDERIAVQQELVVSAAEALEQARILSERGLQTSTRMNAIEKNDADARSKVLELETAKINAARAIASAQRERVRFQADQRETALNGMKEARIQIDQLKLEHGQYLEQVSILSGGNSGLLLGSDSVVLDFSLQSLRDGTRSGTEIDRNTPVFPGDTLIVSARPMDVDIAN